uniref:MAVS n=1 Tax=Azumapecten farreri TaxID=106299 RepID=A0A9E8G2Y9_AZUFA|nr:MAVS [Azumapecten farreri]
MKMAFINDKRIRHFEKQLQEFTKKVDPIELLPYLPCLTQSSKEEIECKQQTYSRSHAALKMYQNLIRMDNWWDQLLDALRSNHQHHLADKLEELDDELSIPRTDRKVQPVFANRKSSRSRKYTGDTRYKDLPARVSAILKIMDSQDVTNNWEAMAAHLRYTNDEVTRMKCNRDQPSCTKKLLEDWSQHEDATLQNLLIALQELERFDLLEQVQKVTGYQLPENREDQLVCDEHQRDENEETSIKINENATPSQIKPDSSSCKFNDHMTGHRQTQGDKSLFPTNGQIGQENERCLSRLCDKTSRFDENVSDPVIQPSISVLWKDKIAVDGSKTPDGDDAEQVINTNSRPSEEGLDSINTQGTSNVCSHSNNNNDDNMNNNTNNNNTDRYDVTHDPNVNALSYPKTMKDKIINQLPLVGGISALGIGVIIALAKTK